MTSSPRTAARGKMTARRLLNKVPEVTIYFWFIKCLCTTVGETFSDDLAGRSQRHPGLGAASPSRSQSLGATIAVSRLSRNPAAGWPDTPVSEKSQYWNSVYRRVMAHGACCRGRRPRAHASRRARAGRTNAPAATARIAVSNCTGVEPLGRKPRTPVRKPAST